MPKLMKAKMEKALRNSNKLLDMMCWQGEATFPSHFPGVFCLLAPALQQEMGQRLTAVSSWRSQQVQGGQPLLLQQKQPEEQKTNVTRPIPRDWCLFISLGLPRRLQKGLSCLQRHSSLGRIWGPTETLLNLWEYLAFCWLHLPVFGGRWNPRSAVAFVSDLGTMGDFSAKWFFFSNKD